MPILDGTRGSRRTLSSDGFRLRRLDATGTGYEPRTDEVVTEELHTLTALLDLSAFNKDRRGLSRLKTFLGRELAPRKTNKNPTWEKESLCAVLDALAETEAQDDAAEAEAEGVEAAEAAEAEAEAEQENHRGPWTLAQVLNSQAVLSDLRYEFDAKLEKGWNRLTPDQRLVLSVEQVKDLLVARALLVRGIRTVEALRSYVLTDPRGVDDVLHYLAVSAAREYVSRQRLDVANLQVDHGVPAKAIVAAFERFSGVGLAADTFKQTVLDTIDTVVGNSDVEKIITDSGLEVPDHLHLGLVAYLKDAPLPPAVSKADARLWVSMYLSQATPRSDTVDAPTASFGEPFKVQFFVEDAAQLQVSTAAVKCASQLFYVMTLGDELGVFDAVRFFTRRYLFREGFAVEDKVLRRDLENYVFSEQFSGRDDGSSELRTMRCTREAERRSFYRQVFDFGEEPVPGDGTPNSDFARLWKILMLESARFLERAQASPNPDNYVSRQNVMQAVEDLQYNLSTNCVGMATVMTPLMYAELDFVVTRILGHPEVRKHLVPSGGSWWKVVEKLTPDRAGRGRASVLHNKARLGYQLIRSIADYTPSEFEQEGPFSEFISAVDAFITTQSILQEESSARRPSSGDSNGNGNGSMGSNGFPGMPAIPGMPQIPGIPSIPGMPPTPGGSGLNGFPGGGGSSPSQPGDEWDF